MIARLVPRGDALFFAPFVAYVAGLMVWLTVGLLPALADVSPTVHQLVHSIASRSGGLAEVAARVEVAGHHADSPIRVALEYGFSTLNLAVSLLLAVRAPRTAVIRLLAVGMVGTAATFNHQSHSVFQFDLLGSSPFVSNLHLLFHITSGVAYIYAVVCFPDGRLVPFAGDAVSRLGWRLVYALVTLQLVVFCGAGRVGGHPGQPFFVAFFGVAVPVAGVVAQTYKRQRAIDVEARQQSRLLRRALVPSLVAGALGLVVPPSDTVAPLLFAGLFAIVPATLILGMLRYRLWAVELAVTRALASSLLLTAMVAVQIAIVVRASSWASGTAALAVGAATIALTTLVLEPLRARAMQLISAWVAPAASPAAAKLAATLTVAPVGEVLPRLARAAAAAVGADRGEARVLLGSGGSLAATWPAGTSLGTQRLTVPVVHGGDIIGELSADRDRPALGEADERALAAVASRAGLALDDVRLTAELDESLRRLAERAVALRASRARLVSARLEARRAVADAIERSGGRRLSEARNHLQAAANSLPRRPGAAVRSLDAASRAAEAALDSLRDLARGVFPPPLADRGLAAAISARADVEATVDEAVARRDVDSATETAVYFCIDEALRTAGSGRRRLRVAVDAGDIELTLSAGLHAARRWESPSLLMDRIDALGGTAEIRRVGGRAELTARIPLGGAPSLSGERHPQEDRPDLRLEGARL